MKFLILAAMLALSATAASQSTVAPLAYDGPLNDGGVIDMATGQILPPNSQVGALSATTGKIYFNKCPANVTTGNTYFYYGMAANNFRIDDGRIPSRTSTPAGLLDNYEITSWALLYLTSEVDVPAGGPGTNLTVEFWDDYDVCTAHAAAGTPSKQFVFTGLRGSTSTLTPPGISGWIYNVAVPPGSWYMLADANGVYDASPNLDTFGQSLSYQPNGTAANGYGSFVGGSYNVPAGDGTYYQNSAALIGTGLGNSQSYVWDLTPSGGTSTCYVGSSTTIGLWGGFWLELTGALDDCNGNGQPDSLDITNGAPDCDANGVPDACDIAAGAPDCNNNGVPDSCDIVFGTSLDTNANGVPDECECGFKNNYCTPGTTTNGCVATIAGVGTPSASAGSGFTLVCSNLEPQQSGIIFYGVNGPVALPWGPTATATSYLCVKAPSERMGVLNTGGGAACTGTMSVDWNLYIATTPGAQGVPFTGGELVWAQGWFRDPPAQKTTSLTDGLNFKVCP